MRNQNHRTEVPYANPADIYELMVQRKNPPTHRSFKHTHLLFSITDVGVKCSLSVCIFVQTNGQQHQLSALWLWKLERSSIHRDPFLTDFFFFLGPAVVFQTPPSEILESFKNVSIFRKKTALSFKRILSCRLATAGATNSAPPNTFLAPLAQHTGSQWKQGPKLNYCSLRFTSSKSWCQLKFRSNKVMETSFFHLRNIIAKVQPFICQKDAEKLIHAFISNRLDYCNALFTGLLKKKRPLRDFSSFKTLQLSY